MMRDTSLLERIATGRRTTRLDVDRAAITDSVLRHLERLFNVRYGSVSTNINYGLPDIAGLCHELPDPRAVYQDAIKDAITFFEPRLRNPVVVAEPFGDEVLKLRFRISANLVSAGAQWEVSFRTRLDAEGRFLVET